ncbi:alpha/beta fold hydrolase [Dactylosporangium sp. NPDC005555]|uniref:alpha/beta fold hydrolase n=1 Tax=Dactylosporangium sp. NPDC005555 TaxID=3154889 RepID=UPI0033B3B61B
MTHFILVPGMWLGGWAWDAVAAPLRAAGHDVTALDLDLSAGATLDTHISQVTAAVGDAADVVLVGHSYGGLPVRGAADRVKVARVIYVDSGPLPDGVAQADVSPPGDTDGVFIPPPSFDPADDPVQFAGLIPALLRRAVPHPLASALSPLRLSSASQPPTELICTTFPLELVRQMIDSDHPFFAGLDRSDYRVHELPTGHWAMFSRPADLAELLIRLS